MKPRSRTAGEPLTGFSPPSAPPLGVHDLIASLDTLVHGLTQPITALRGMLEVSLLGELSVAEYQEAIRDALAQAERLADSVLQIKAAIESADLGDELEGLSWAEAVGKAVRSIQPLAQARGVSILMNLEENSFVRAHRRRLDFATRKCLGIAVERCPAGSSIRIILRPSGRQLVLSVADQGCGPGLAAEKSARDPKRRPHRAARGSLEGSWRVVRRLMRAQGGEARIRKFPPHGCRFELHLPQSPLSYAARRMKYF